MPFNNSPKYYHVWGAMKDRCLNPRNKQYKDYGGRGIYVCNEWLHSYETFASDMGERPENHSIDRIDNDGPYSKENCRWASRKEQQRNQRRAVYVMIEGVRYRAIELSETYGIKTDTIQARAAKGMRFEQVVSKEKFLDLSGLAKGGKANGARRRAQTHCKNGHFFSEDTTYITPEGWRRCRLCRRVGE